jgi:hypothetical protein
MAPMQKRAWWGLGLGAAFAAAFIAVFFAMGGVDEFDSNASFRIIVDIFAIGALAVNLVVVNVPLRKPGMADERDLRIIERAPRVQWLAVIFALVGWTVGLTEIYHETRLIPSVYLYVMFLSVLIVSTLAQCLGILIGYGRPDKNG